MALHITQLSAISLISLLSFIDKFTVLGLPKSEWIDFKTIVINSNNI